MTSSAGRSVLVRTRATLVRNKVKTDGRLIVLDRESEKALRSRLRWWRGPNGSENEKLILDSSWIRKLAEMRAGWLVVRGYNCSG